MDPLSSEHLRQACGSFPTGVTVTTCIGDDQEPHGITVNSFTSVSLDPPLVLVCIDRRSQMVRHLSPQRRFAVNVLSAGQEALSARFAATWRRRFEGVAWYPGLTGAPLLDGVAAGLECVVLDVHPAGDHVIVLGQVFRTFASEQSPLVYVRRRYGTVQPVEPQLCQSGRAEVAGNG